MAFMNLPQDCMRIDPTSQNAFRLCAPDETYKLVQPHLAALGITRVACQTGLDRIGIPVWCAYVPNAKAIVIAQGKGLDDAAARISAVMEAVERVVATEPACKTQQTSAKALALAGHRLDCLDCLIARHKQPLSPDEKITWAEGFHLLDADRVWLPFDALDFDRTCLSPRFWQSSDGLASGNTPEEAVLHGLLERIERDALALWTVTGSRSRFGRRINPDHASPALQAVLTLIERAALQIALFDLTTDLQIPVVAALLAPKDSGAGLRHVDITLGAGAALTASGAVLRAVLEAVQSRMTFIAGARDDLVPSVFQRPADLSHLAAFSAPFDVEISQMPSYSATSTTQALALVVRQLADRGISELFAVDLGPKHLPVSVVRVFAPELENPDGARRVRFGPRALSQSFT